MDNKFIMHDKQNSAHYPLDFCFKSTRSINQWNVFATLWIRTLPDAIFFCQSANQDHGSWTRGPFSTWSVLNILGQPGALEGARCAVFMHKYSYQWEAQSCYETRRFVCEREPSEHALFVKKASANKKAIGVFEIQTPHHFSTSDELSRSDFKIC